MPVLYEKKVSVIVPAYNCSHTINRCIYSLLDQEYEHYEVIILDDGSDDDTGVICQRAADISDKIRYFRLDHRGVSLVRNEGLRHAKGEYLMFVDADDYVRRDYISRMVSSIQCDDDCDMCICSYERVIFDGLYPIKKLQRPGLIRRQRYLLNTLKDPGHHYFGVLWNKIFKRSIIESNNISFNKDISLGEDFVFTLKYLRYASKIKIINDKLYYYCYQNQGSSLSRINHKTIQDCMTEMDSRNIIFDVYGDVFKSEGIYKVLEKRLYHYWIVFLLRQRYSLNREYQWTDNDKSLWQKMMYENININKAIKMYGKKAIDAEYKWHYISQSIKNIGKFFVKLSNAKLGCEEKNEVQKIPE